MSEQVFSHKPVLLDECIEALAIRPEGVYLDGTLGRAGHSREIVRRLTTGRLICVDRDQAALDAAEERLAPWRERVTLVHSNFCALDAILDGLGLDGVDGMLFDLGVSSPQLDDASRGFSYRTDAPLDMRMDQTDTLTARAVVNEWPQEELRRIRGEGETLWAYLEEGQALRAKVLTAADTFGAVEWRRVSGMNTVMTDYFALAPRHARDAILPIKHPLRTDDIHYIQAQKQTLLLYTAYDRVRARLGFQAMALLLDGEPQFLICPGGLILNTDKVSRVEGRVVALENGKRLMLEEPAVRELQAR
ncbi:MAG: 16S rRNA (cytosine(1402)-N(4))-methyltransferase RsmH, partial [Flavonifractor plautii]